MRALAELAIDTAAARGASYADVRVRDSRFRTLSTKNGQPGTIDESESAGLGIRVLAGGAWGFASTHDLSKEGVEAAAARAVEIARASALVKKKDVVLAPEQKIEAVWRMPIDKDPFEISMEDQLGPLFAADKELRAVKGVTLAETSMNFTRIEQYFASTLGSWLDT